MLQPAVFTVDTLEAGSGEVLVYVEDPEGHTEEVSMTQSLSAKDLNQNAQHLLFNLTAPVLCSRQKSNPTKIKVEPTQSLMFQKLKVFTR